MAQLADLFASLQSEYGVEDDIIMDAIDYGNGRLIILGLKRISIEQLETEARKYLDNRAAYDRVNRFYDNLPTAKVISWKNIK